MAIFASTTTSGYSDPLRAQSIKALEQRLKDQQAQQAAQQPDAAMMATIPGGLGHVASVLGDKIQQGRNEQALAAQKDVLAKAMVGYDYSQPPPAAIATASPELYKEMLETWAANRRSKETTDAARYGSDNTLKGTQYSSDASSGATRYSADQSSGASRYSTDKTTETQTGLADKRIEADKAAAVELARNTEQSKVDAEYRANQRPQDEVAKIELDVTNGRMTREQADARIKKLLANTPSEEKLLIGERDKAIEYQSTLKELDKAHELINSPKGIHSGNALTTPLKTAVGSVIPQSLGGPDDETQANTKQFNQIMKSQGLQNLLAMKGASSDKDVTLNLEIANDPSQPLQRRKEALNIARNKLYTHVEANKADIARISGEYPKLQAAPGGGPAAAATDVPRPAGKTDSQLIAEAEAAKKAGKPAAAVDAQLQKWLMGK